MYFLFFLSYNTYGSDLGSTEIGGTKWQAGGTRYVQTKIKRK